MLGIAKTFTTNPTMTTRLLLAILALPLFAAAQDTSLHDFLIDGEPWKEAVNGYTFTDGLCTDAAGNLFFTDVKAGKGIYKEDGSLSRQPARHQRPTDRPRWALLRMP